MRAGERARMPSTDDGAADDDDDDDIEGHTRETGRSLGTRPLD